MVDVWLCVFSKPTLSVTNLNLFLKIFIGMEAFLNKDLCFSNLLNVRSLPSMKERNNNSDKLCADL